MGQHEIRKYKLERGETELDIPADARILCAKVQSNELHIWALVNPEYDKETRTFGCFLTGQPVDYEDKTYINTIFIDGGRYVVHVFEML